MIFGMGTTFGLGNDSISFIFKNLTKMSTQHTNMCIYLIDSFYLSVNKRTQATQPRKVDTRRELVSDSLAGGIYND